MAPDFLGKRALMRAGAKAGERPARWWQSQESVNPDCTPFPRAAQARGGAPGDTVQLEWSNQANACV